MRHSYLIIICFLLLVSCSKDETNSDMDYKKEMRDFVIGISTAAKTTNASFFVIPQNGIELATINGEDDGAPHTAYLNAIDGNGQEDLFYGYDFDDQATPANENLYIRTLLNVSKNVGNTILVTDYCSTQSKMADSYSQNNNNAYVSFAADQRELSNIPSYPNPIFGENNATITQLSEIQNFLYLINPVNFVTKTAFVNAITATNYDLIIMDLFFHDGTEFSSSEITQLKNKANGGKRLVISYMSIGEAEDYRYYWQNAWNTTKPEWMDLENPDWPGNFKVKYWDEAWQDIIFGNENSYLNKITNAGFDGIYLDIIDGFEYFESAL